MTRLFRGAAALIDLPPFWLLGFMGLSWGAQIIAPMGLTPPWPWIGAAVIAAAILFAVWAVAAFQRAQTPVMPRRAPTRLVSTGPYRWSRNPIYVADVAILLGWGAVLGSIWPILAAPLFVRVLRRRFIDGEEAALRRAHPEAWRRWSAQTRRWL